MTRTMRAKRQERRANSHSVVPASATDHTTNPACANTPSVQKLSPSYPMPQGDASEGVRATLGVAVRLR